MKSVQLLQESICFFSGYVLDKRDFDCRAGSACKIEYARFVGEWWHQNEQCRAFRISCEEGNTYADLRGGKGRG